MRKILVSRVNRKTHKILFSRYCILDNEDYERVKLKKWLINGEGYVCTWINKGTKILRLHNYILNHTPSKNSMIDHINHNKLDNRKDNLRIVTHQQNMWNRQKNINKTISKYKGVSYIKQEHRIKRWVAYLFLNKKRITIGRFLTEKEAALAYDNKAKEIFGEYAKLNF